LREYRIRYGPFAGSHWIYDNPKEFNEKVPDVGYKRWDQQIDFKALQAGEWVEAEDGFIVQCLKNYFLEDKKYGNVKYVIRFPMNTTTCYDRKTKPPRVPKFVANKSIDNSNMSGQSSRLKFSDAQKVMWAELVLAGADPVGAYRVAFNDKKFYTGPQMMAKIMRLIQEPKIRNIIMAYIKRFSNSLKEKYSEKQLLKDILAHGEATKAGSVAKLTYLKFIHEIYKEEDSKPFGSLGRGRTPRQITTGEQATDTEFDEIDSPLN